MMLIAYILLALVTFGLCFVKADNMAVEAHAVTLGVVRGILIFIVLYIACLWIYFALRKRLQKRYAAEIIVIGSVAVLSIVGKMLVSYFVEVGSSTFVDVSRDAWDNTAKFYYSVYQALGGISFEGLAEYELYEAWRTMIYAGGSLLAGGVAISILTFSISYQIYSYFSWKSFQGKRRAKIYVFTAVTEDAVILAHSINEKNKEIRRSQKFGNRYAEEKRKEEERKDWDERRYLTLKEAEEMLGKRGLTKVAATLLSPFYQVARAVRAFAFAVARAFRSIVPLRHKYAIIFLRTEGEEGFDSKNALHADIMHSGFLFMTYNPGKKDKSIARFLGIKADNDGCIKEQPDNSGEKAENKYKRQMKSDRIAEFHVFALDWEKDRTSENDNVVAQDIARRAKETFANDTFAGKIRRREAEKQALVLLGRAEAEEKENYHVPQNVNELMEKAFGTKLVVNYHYLLSEEIDIANVDMRFDCEISKFRKEKYYDDEHVDFLAIAGNEAYEKTGKSEGYAKYYGVFKRHFVLHAINEANMAAMLYIKARGELIKTCPELYKEDVSGNMYRALVIGFGLNGQQTLKAAYIFAAAGKFKEKVNYVAEGETWKEKIKKSDLAVYETQPFLADVYDKNADDLGGLFKMRHPAFKVELPSDRDKKDVCCPSFAPAVSETDKRTYCRVCPYLMILLSEKRDNERYRYDCANVEVKLYRESAYSDTILKELDKNLGEKGSEYNLIVIALGDDDSNVSIANTLLEDYKHEFKCDSNNKLPGKMQVFAINLRDKLNYDRINWCKKNEEEFKGLKVVIYGAAEDMYSYDNIVDRSAAKIWNAGYQAIQGNKNGDSSYAKKLEKDIDAVCSGKGDGVSIKNYIETMKDGSKDKANNESDWLKEASNMMYNMTSSLYAARLSPFVAEYCRIIEKKRREKNAPDAEDRGGISFASIVTAGAVEHDRWIRFLLSNGYVKNSVSDKHLKMHMAIMKYNEIDTQNNDITNVLNALIYDGVKKRS